MNSKEKLLCGVKLKMIKYGMHTHARTCTCSRAHTHTHTQGLLENVKGEERLTETNTTPGMFEGVQVPFMVQPKSKVQTFWVPSTRCS